jgi:hypothetical protein
MNHVTCELNVESNRLAIKRDGVTIGTVVEIGVWVYLEWVSEPAIHLYPITAPAVLTFNDIEIIMDNWNQMQEIRKQSVRESAEGL